MSAHDIDKAYVSPYDKFLKKFDVEHEKTASQEREIKKHQRIFYLRDNPVAPSDEKLWSEF